MPDVVIRMRPNGPIVVEGKVLTGRTCGGQRANCYISAHDARTGTEVWKFFTAAGSDEPGGETWANPAGGADNGGMQGQRQPAVGPDGTVYMTAWSTFRDPCNGSCLYAFNPNGTVRWTYSPWPANGMSEPTVGADGTVYVGRSLSYLDAVRPNGTARWTTTDGTILAHPTVNPQNTLVLAGDAANYGMPGTVRGYSAANGQLLWEFGLPSENGGFQTLYSRPRFARDGQTAYFGTFISAPDSPDQYAYLYAVDTSGTAPPPSPPATTVTLSSLALSPAQVSGGAASTGTVTLSGAAPSGGVSVTLAGNNPSVATVPPSVTVAAGANRVSFKVLTSRVSARTAVTITASAGGVTKTARLTVRR